MQELDIIKNTSILSEDDFAFLSGLSEELRDTLKKRQIFRTHTEMEVSVLDDIHFPTPASKYWQAVREQGTMMESLISEGFDYRRNEIKIRRLQKKIAECEDEFDRDEATVDLDECMFRRTNMEIIARDRIRELRLWSQIKSELDDGSFNTKDVNVHQLVSYAQRFILQAYNAKDMSVGEAANLNGQLLTSLREAETKGLLRDVVATLPEPVIEKVLLKPGLLKLSQQQTTQQSEYHNG